MAYVIATTETQVRWYRFLGWDSSYCVVPLRYETFGPLELHETLDLGLIRPFDSKEDAKLFALAAGLRTWRYVKI